MTIENIINIDDTDKENLCVISASVSEETKKAALDMYQETYPCEYFRYKGWTKIDGTTHAIISIKLADGNYIEAYVPTDFKVFQHKVTAEQETYISAYFDILVFSFIINLFHRLVYVYCVHQPFLPFYR